MDDSDSSQQITLDINPDMITTQTGVPSTTFGPMSSGNHDVVENPITDKPIDITPRDQSATPVSIMTQDQSNSHDQPINLPMGVSPSIDQSKLPSSQTNNTAVEASISPIQVSLPSQNPLGSLSEDPDLVKLQR